VRSWLDSVGDAYMAKKDLGDSLDSAYSLQEECLNVEAQLMVGVILSVRLSVCRHDPQTDRFSTNSCVVCLRCLTYTSRLDLEIRGHRSSST